MEHSWRRAVNDAATGLAIHNVKRLPKRGESGFTLVEVLVAIVVLSITGLAAAQFAITAIRTSYAQQQRSAAIALGSDGIERMRAQIADHTSAPSSYYTDLLPGMGVDDVKKAHANLTAVGAITSQFSDLEATATPDADTSKYIQPVNTVIEKCYRESGTMDCRTASELGIDGHASISGLDGTPDASLRFSILSQDNIPTKGFTFMAKTYMPMVRVVVGVTWSDNIDADKTAVYTTNELLNVIGA